MLTIAVLYVDLHYKLSYIGFFAVVFLGASFAAGR